MGKAWDNSGIAYSVPMWRECLRVLKPGGHLLSFGGSRTYHRMACAIEDAGFEIRDQIMWLYGCLDEQTELVSEDGIKHYHKATIGERVLCYSIENGEYSYQPILEIVEYDYSDTAYRLIGDFGEQVVSRNHRCIVERDGGEVFQLAETVGTEACVPVLENLPELQQAFSNLQSDSGGSEQVVQPRVCQGVDWESEKYADSAGEKKRQNGFLRGLWNREMDTAILVEESQEAYMQPQVQRRSQGSAVEATRARGAETLETGIGVRVKNSDDGRDESSVEGRIDLPEAQRGVCRPADKVCSLPVRVPEHGAEGRLCDGTSSPSSSGNWQTSPESRSCTSQESQSDGESTNQPNAVCDERGTQGIRAWRGHKTAVVRVVPFQYSGKVWCLRVSTGAFVAVRGGVAFPTGNSGFPKSLDVSKAIDKRRATNDVIRPWLRSLGSREEIAKAAQVSPRQVDHWLGENKTPCPQTLTEDRFVLLCGAFDTVPEWANEMFACVGERLGAITHGRSGGDDFAKRPGSQATARTVEEFAPATDAAKQWDGWGTALKPAHEPICVARKPIEGTVAANVQKHGTGALNIDGCRIEYESDYDQKHQEDICRGQANANNGKMFGGTGKSIASTESPTGRWPANVIHDGSDEVVSLFPESKSCMSPSNADCEGTIFGGSRTQGNLPMDSGSAARFYYCAKVSKEERERGINDMTLYDVYSEDSATPMRDQRQQTQRRNNHPTIKPVDLMCYLCRLVTPKGGTVLDCFMGSGSTGIAAMREGFNFIGVEISPEYAEIAGKRISAEAPMFNEVEVK